MNINQKKNPFYDQPAKEQETVLYYKKKSQKKTLFYRLSI